MCLVNVLSNFGLERKHNLLGMPKNKKKKIAKRGRSAKTGRFMTLAAALKDKATSVIERIFRRKK